MSDWQLGKKDWGSINTVKHIRQALVKAKAHIKELNKTCTIDEIYIIGLGDLIENCFGFYDHQPFNIELTKSEQEHLTRKMIMEIVDAFLPLAPNIILGGVPDITHQSTHYHAKYVNPWWAKKMELTVSLGDHIFYR